MTTPAHDGWTPVWSALRMTATPAEQVYDLGEQWVFRFASQGQPAGEVTLSRADLERAKWHVEIPPRIEEELRTRGVRPPP